MLELKTNEKVMCINQVYPSNFIKGPIIDSGDVLTIMAWRKAHNLHTNLLTFKEIFEKQPGEVYWYYASAFKLYINPWEIWKRLNQP